MRRALPMLLLAAMALRRLGFPPLLVDLEAVRRETVGEELHRWRVAVGAYGIEGDETFEHFIKIGGHGAPFGGAFWAGHLPVQL